MSDSRTGVSVGRPRVRVTPEDVYDLRSKGVSWRRIAKHLKIGTATAMRLFRQSIKVVPLPES
jgi:transposase-like protein